jgi:hypothetical protein
MEFHPALTLEMVETISQVRSVLGSKTEHKTVLVADDLIAQANILGGGLQHLPQQHHIVRTRLTMRHRTLLPSTSVWEG